MRETVRRIAIALLVAAAPADAATLPDTGVISCYTSTAIDSVTANVVHSIARDVGTHPRQDCRYGADVADTQGALVKVGSGTFGFDYTKIANDGSVLPASAPLGSSAGAWACTRDNNTGLTWEVKTTAPTHLRYLGHTYAWFDANGTTNGGSFGGGGNVASCNSTLIACQTQNFQIAVNAAQLCGMADWRLPSMRELSTLVHFGAINPAIDTTYFPATSSFYWTASASSSSSAHAWKVDFLDGTTSTDMKTSINQVRLVRGAGF